MIVGRKKVGHDLSFRFWGPHERREEEIPRRNIRKEKLVCDKLIRFELVESPEIFAQPAKKQSLRSREEIQPHKDSSLTVRYSGGRTPKFLLVLRKKSLAINRRKSGLIVTRSLSGRIRKKEGMIPKPAGAKDCKKRQGQWQERGKRAKSELFASCPVKLVQRNEQRKKPFEKNSGNQQVEN